MPWTIWPALVVLWGVCWMFYYEQSQPPSDDIFRLPVAGIYHAENLLDLPLASDALLFDLDLNVADWSHPYGTPPSLAFDPTIFSVNPADTITSTPVASAFRPSQASSTPLETRPPEMTTFTAPASSALSQVQEQSLDEVRVASTDGQQDKPSKNTRHSQTEKYFCTYSDCQRAQPGFGFKRKDNRDQHLRTTHKQVLVETIRAPPVMAPGSSTPASNTELFLQSKKRKRKEDDESDLHGVEALKTELGRVQQENLELRQKVIKYEERMEKYEQRLDTLMSLFGQQNGLVGKNKE